MAYNEAFVFDKCKLSITHHIFCPTVLPGMIQCHRYVSPFSAIFPLISTQSYVVTIRWNRLDGRCQRMVTT